MNMSDMHNDASMDSIGKEGESMDQQAEIITLSN